MGISLSFTGRRNIKMKAVALFSLIAVAFAEPEAKADPWLTYGYGHLGYAGYGHAYAGYPYAHSVYYGKREAAPKAMVPTPPTTLDTTTARGRPRLSPRLMPMLSTTERGRPRLSLRLMPTLATALAMLDTVLDTTAMLGTPMLTLDTSTARGRPRLSLRLMVMDTDPTDTDTPAPTPMAMAVDTTGDKSSDQATNRLD